MRKEARSRMSFFDAYEIRARLMPAALIASPLVLPLFAFGLVSASMSTALASALLVMVIYLFSHVVAFLGRRSEPALWESWGGSPSLTVLSDADKTFPAVTKKAIQKAILDIYSMDLEAVAGDAAKWREQGTEAFRLVRQYLRQHDPKGVWTSQNAEYGFIRNTLASAWLCAVLAGLVAAVSCGVPWWFDHAKTLHGALAIVAVVIGVVVLVIRFALLPKVARSIAFRYSESAWLCFLNASKTGGKASKGGGD
mgnify:CR=1 FL=1